MKKGISNILRSIGTFLSHPAWTGIGAIATAVGVIGLSVIYIWFRGVFNSLVGWFEQQIYISRIMLIITIIIPIIIIAIINKLLQNIRAAKNKVLPREAIPYFSYWNVLWRIGDNTNRDTGFTGPYCPSHFLEMKVSREKNAIIFKCQGLAINETHQIRGPDISQLIIPIDNPEYIGADVLIRLDLIARIKANQRRNEILNK